MPFFMEIFMVGAWCLWNERNALIFNGKIPSLAAWKNSFKHEVSAHLIRSLASTSPFDFGLMPCNLQFSLFFRSSLCQLVSSGSQCFLQPLFSICLISGWGSFFSLPLKVSCKPFACSWFYYSCRGALCPTVLFKKKIQRLIQIFKKMQRIFQSQLFLHIFRT